MKTGKRYTAAAQGFDRSVKFTEVDALELVKKNATAKFDETIELHIRTGCDSRHADQQVRGSVVLPAGTGKKVRILVFAKGAKADEAQAAGADFVGAEELIPKIQDGWFDYDVIIATPDMMGVVGRLGRVLGPKGLMPNPKTGTVTMDVAKAIREVKQGKIDFKVDKTGIVHTSIGKVSFTPEQIFGNAKEFIATINKLKPAAAKGTYIKSIYLSSTMSKGIKVDPKSVDEI